ncbi:MAG: hypothetical protein RJB38_1547 [Pseudomonadota bacterium]|jgi:flagellar basal-body rod modification protein FlgD
MIGSVGRAQEMRKPQVADTAAASDLQRGIEVDSSVKVGAPAESNSPTEPKFGDIWKKIQGEMGAKAEKPREIKKTLDKDDFLRLMIMQMKYQDPSKPFEMEKMGAEMAQLSSMEQLQNLNQTMKQLANRDQPVERLAMTGMIGKTIAVDRERFPHVEGQSQNLKFILPTDASQVTVTVLDQTGTPILEQDLGPQKKGEGSFSWDGKKANRFIAKSGNYTYRVKALNDQGQEMNLSQQTSARVVGVSFEGQKPVLLIGDISNPQRVFMESVTRIVDEAPSSGTTNAGLIPGAKSLSEAVSGSKGSESTGNFFTFKKGEGSRPLDLSALPPEESKVLQAYQRQSQSVDRPSGVESQDQERGFANGLSSAE